MKKEIQKLQKLIVICGPTASGKTSWSLKLAQKYDGEIISADSRQIYKKMDIGTAKEKGEWRTINARKTFYIEEIPHHLMDFLDPGKNFTVAEFRDKAVKYAKLAHYKGNIPFIVGGTGLYIHSVVDNLNIPRVPPNKKLRESLETKANEELMVWLKKLDPVTAKTVDPNNNRRIIRALEVCILSGKPFSAQQQKGEPIFDILQIAIDQPREVLYDRINKRVDEQIKSGLLKEIKNLLKQKYSWDLPSMSGIGYRQFKDYFEGTMSLEQAIENLKKANRNYAKRQITWFKRDPRIHWVKNFEEADNLILNFLEDGNKK
ncbi:MAG TPA: tRNA (adenosine(37)-N6)-dimethylallyltransferase MiaA [Candidatus Magasanikbacteria bacterium]|jgi:tRNA dimethylallyltransferase|nr:tRNA (adenosine(37)-N6)-dimethylallyltransferase MiaA [Candidatus Magasanikbacteria bacterium]HQF57240.1 tRNA (adenosine(37)-N6)-dimethylallyltransferase MiaA [Candidatus Magasanikbacteria bacterium]HQL52631.1 tRNA (adenosine(37)-N6)-dimethylallyltransferase MiaA [Candidatus Magasanikbacteria bacterium]